MSVSYFIIQEYQSILTFEVKLKDMAMNQFLRFYQKSVRLDS